MLLLLQEVVALAGKVSVNRSRKTSMLQDIEAGRKTELEVFAGKVVSMGMEYSISIPVIKQPILHMIKELKNRPGTALM